jgi:hypothetical protein
MEYTAMSDDTETAITPFMREVFEALSNGILSENTALMSCKLDGIPTSSIVVVDRDAVEGMVKLTPLFVYVNDEIGLKLSDMNDVPASISKEDLH